MRKILLRFMSTETWEGVPVRNLLQAPTAVFSLKDDPIPIPAYPQDSAITLSFRVRKRLALKDAKEWTNIFYWGNDVDQLLPAFDLTDDPSIGRTIRVIFADKPMMTDVLASNKRFPELVWLHVALVMSRTHAVLYVDGDKVAETTFRHTHDFSLARKFQFTRYYDPSVDIARLQLFYAPLTEQQIRTLAQDGEPLPVYPPSKILIPDAKNLFLNKGVVVPPSNRIRMFNSTLSFWIRKFQEVPFWRNLFEVGSGDQMQLGLYTHDIRAPLHLVLRSANQLHSLNIDTDLPLREWSHVAVALRNQRVQVFHDGELVESRELPESIPGNWVQPLHYSMLGDPAVEIAHFQWFEEALSPEQIARMYADRPVLPGLPQQILNLPVAPPADAAKLNVAIAKGLVEPRDEADKPASLAAVAPEVLLDAARLWEDVQKKRTEVKNGTQFLLRGSVGGRVVFEGGRSGELAGPSLQLPGGAQGSSSLRFQRRSAGSFVNGWDFQFLKSRGMTMFFVGEVPQQTGSPFPRILQIAKGPQRFPALDVRVEQPGNGNVLAGMWKTDQQAIFQAPKTPMVLGKRSIIALRVRVLEGEPHVSIWNDLSAKPQEAKGDFHDVDLSNMELFSLGRAFWGNVPDLPMEICEFQLYQRALGDEDMRRILRQLADKWADNLVLQDASKGTSAAVPSSQQARPTSDPNLKGVPPMSGPNLHGYVVTASSTLDSSEAPWRLADGRAQSLWRSSPDAALPQWIMLRFPEVRTVAEYALTAPSQASYMTHAPFTWDVQVSMDEKTWTTVDRISGANFSQPGQVRNYRVAKPADGLYVRIIVHETRASASAKNNRGPVALSGFQVFGKPSDKVATLSSPKLNSDRDQGYIVLASSSATGTQPQGAVSDGEQVWRSDAPVSTKPQWIAIQFPRPLRALQYTLMIDEVDTAPKTWRLEGSTNNQTWTMLDQRSQIAFRDRQSRQTFAIQNTRDATMFRLLVQNTQRDGRPVALRHFGISGVAPEQLQKGSSSGAVISGSAKASEVDIRLGDPEIAFRARDLTLPMSLRSGATVPAAGSWKTMVGYNGTQPAQVVQDGAAAVRLPGGPRGTSGLQLLQRSEGKLTPDWDMGRLLETGFTFLLSARVRSLRGAFPRLFSVGRERDLLAFYPNEKGQLYFRASNPEFTRHLDVTSATGALVLGSPDVYGCRMTALQNGTIEVAVFSSKGVQKAVHPVPQWKGLQATMAMIGRSPFTADPDLSADVYEFRYFQSSLGDDAVLREMRAMKEGILNYRPRGEVEKGRQYTTTSTTEEDSIQFGKLTRRVSKVHPQAPIDFAEDFDLLFADSSKLQGDVVNSFAVPDTENTAVEFSGFLNVPRDGTYVFETPSDDGSDLALFADNRWTVVTKNYGIRSPNADVERGVQGEIMLREGVYPIRIRYHNATQRAKLAVRWKAPGAASLQPIPWSALGVHKSGPVSGGALLIDTPIELAKVQKVAVPGSELPDVRDAMTIAFWLRRTANVTSGEGVNVFHWGQGSTDRRPSFWIRPQLPFDYRVSTTKNANEGGFGPQPVSINEWQHVTFITSGQTIRLMVDGREVRSIQLQGTPVINADDPFRFGNSVAAAPASLAKLRIFPRALRVDEVKALMEEDPVLPRGEGLIQKFMDMEQVKRLQEKAAVESSSATSGVGSGASEVRLQDGLFCHYVFEEGAGDWTKDHAGMKRDGLVLGQTQWLKDQAAIRLIQKGDGLVFEEPIKGPTATVAFWYQMQPSSTTEWYALLAKQGGGNYPLILHPGTLKLGFWADKGVSGGYKENGFHYTTQGPETKIEVGRWVHLLVAMEDKKYTLYINGKKVMAVSNFYGLHADRCIDLLGSSNGWDQVATGLVRDVRGWTRRLNESEVRAVYNSPYKPRSLTSSPRGDLPPLPKAPAAGIKAKLEEDLLLHYSFQEGGASGVQDESDANNHGMIFGDPSMDRTKGILRIEREGQSVRFGRPIQDTPVTVSFWHRRDPGAKDWASFLSRRGGNAQQLVVHPLTNKAGFWGDSGKAGYREFQWHATSPDNRAYFPIGKWVHVVVVMNGPTYRLYFNRRPVLDLPYFYGVDKNRMIELFSTADGIKQPAMGLFRDLRIWKRALTVDEIQHLYAFSGVVSATEGFQNPRPRAPPAVPAPRPPSALRPDFQAGVRTVRPTCRDQSTDWQKHEKGFDVRELSRHQVQCSANEKLARLQLETKDNPNQSRFQYRCCTTLGGTTGSTFETAWADVQGGSSLSMASHSMKCSAGGSFQVLGSEVHDTQQQMRFRGECTLDEGSLDCRPMVTEWKPETPEFRQLRNHDIACSDGEGIGAVRMERDNKGQARFEYQCCRPYPAVVRWLNPAQQPAGGATRVEGRVAVYKRAEMNYTDFGKQSFAFGKNEGCTVLCKVRFRNPGENERIVDFGNGPAKQNLVISRWGLTTDLRIQLFGDTPEDVFMARVPGILRLHAWITMAISMDGEQCTVHVAGLPKPFVFSMKNTPEVLTDRTCTYCYVGRSHWPQDALLEGDVRTLSVYDYAVPQEALEKLVAIVHRWGG